MGCHPVAVVIMHVRGFADNSLARSTNRCCRWKEGSLNMPNCKSFLVTEAERWHVRRRARFQHREASCYQVFFPARQGAKENSRNSDRNIRGTCTIVCHRQKLGGPF